MPILEPRFRITAVTCDLSKVSTDSAAAATTLCEVLKGIEFVGCITESNSQQLNQFLERAVCERLVASNCELQDEPRFNGPNAEALPSAKADFIFRVPGSPTRVVVEIEKANRKTIWFDFIKLWMFLSSGQASAAVLVVPQVYAHKHGVWTLYADARSYLLQLQNVAEVSAHRIASIAIIGYSQEVFIDDRWVAWSSAAFRQLKL